MTTPDTAALNIEAAKLVGLSEDGDGFYVLEKPYYRRFWKGSVEYISEWELWNPCENLEQAWLVQAKAIEKVGAYEFVECLAKVEQAIWAIPKELDCWLATAGPEARTRAAVKAMEG